MTGDFYGLPTRIIDNGKIRVEFLREAGPRIVRLFVNGSDENQLAEVPEAKAVTPFGDYYFRGGHRLWHSPEAFPRSYLPDNAGLSIEESNGEIRLVSALEPATAIRKSISIRLHENQAALTLTHELRNDGMWQVELAPWAITQFRLGGVVILPQRVEPFDKDSLLPNRALVLWHYTSWHDPRLQLDDEYIFIRAQARTPPCKIGYLNHAGWIGYWREGIFFRKRFEPRVELPYPDFGCNAECYCGEEFVEVETVAPLARLEPGASVTHTEVWEFFKGLDDVDLPESLKQKLGSS